MAFQYICQSQLFPEYTLHSFFRNTEPFSHNLRWGKNKDLLAISFEGEMRSQKQKWIQIYLLQNIFTTSNIFTTKPFMYLFKAQYGFTVCFILSQNTNTGNGIESLWTQWKLFYKNRNIKELESELLIFRVWSLILNRIFFLPYILVYYNYPFVGNLYKLWMTGQYHLWGGWGVVEFIC